MPQCDCHASAAAGLLAMVKTTIMEGTSGRHGWNEMVQFGHCDKILKYFGTAPWTDPRTGERGYRTVTW